MSVDKRLTHMAVGGVIGLVFGVFLGFSALGIVSQITFDLLGGRILILTLFVAMPGGGLVGALVGVWLGLRLHAKQLRTSPRPTCADRREGIDQNMRRPSAGVARIGSRQGKKAT